MKRARIQWQFGGRDKRKDIVGWVIQRGFVSQLGEMPLLLNGNARDRTSAEQMASILV